jgi:hypothetical protein
MIIYTFEYWLARRGLTAIAGTTFIRAILLPAIIIHHFHFPFQFLLFCDYFQVMDSAQVDSTNYKNYTFQISKGRSDKQIRQSSFREEVLQVTCYRPLELQLITKYCNTSYHTYHFQPFKFRVMRKGRY